MLKLIGRLLLFLPIFLGMMFVSYRVDPSGLFWGAGFERMVCDYMLQGQYVDGYQQLDGRELNEIYARECEKAPQILVNGSSRTLQIDSSFADGKTLYNAANVGADVYDFFNSYYIFAKESKEPEIFVMGIDPWIFNDGKENIDERSNKEMFNEFLVEIMDYESTEYTPENPMEKYKALLDPSYFQASVDTYFRNQNTENQPEIVPMEEVYNNKDIVKSPDGSIVYDLNFRTRPQETADGDALTASVNDLLRMTDYDQLDPYYTQLFEDFIEYLQQKDIKIIFFLPSFHHYIYWAAQADMGKYHCLFKVEDYIKSTGDKYGIPVYGSYDPDAVGLTNKDFMDGYHMRYESLKKVLPTIE
ncbi:MAG: hypothetical protein IKY90_04600 [Oscillospiraceae bacterium]|nr:hypothetical protein [Oscillospiraceae bacterium]